MFKSILIGSAGAGNAFSSVIALRRNWGSTVKITSIDCNPGHLVTASLISDKFYQVPKINELGFKNEVTKICMDESIDTYIPLMDDEIFVAASLYEQGYLDSSIYLQVKCSEIADICNDKYKTFLLLNERNILTPECFMVGALLNSNGNYIIKPRRGFGSHIKKLSKINGDISQFNSESTLIQYECEKPELTIDVCYSKKQDVLLYVCRERLEIKSGVCTKARLFYDDELESIAYRIANELDLFAFCFQVMRYKDKWAVTDINARLGAGTAMSYAAGMDFFSGMFAVLWGENPTVYFRPLEKETYVTRQYSDFLMQF